MVVVRYCTYIFEVWQRAYGMTDWTSTPSLAGCDEKWVENLTGLLSNHNWSETLQPIVGKLRLGEKIGRAHV